MSNEGEFKYNQKECLKGYKSLKRLYEQLDKGLVSLDNERSLSIKYKPIYKHVHLL